MIPVHSQFSRRRPVITAPGGGGFSPTDLAGLYGWWKADAGLYDADSGGSLVTTDGTAAGRWEDQSGTGNHLVQATSANRPVLKTAIQNGLPVVRFDGSNDNLKKTFTRAQPVHVFMVARFHTTPGSFGTYIDGGTLNAMRVYCDTGTSIRMFAGGSGPGASTTHTAWRVLSFLFNGASSGLWINGGSQNTGNPGTGTTGGLTVGATANNTERGAIDVAELVAYDWTGRSDADRQSVRDYLNGRWGIY